MDKNNTSNSSVCSKIRQAIHKISSYHQDPKPINFASNSPSQSPIPHQHVDNNSTFIPIEQENSASTIASAQQQGKVAKVSPPFVAKNSETAKITTTTTTTKVVAKGETQQPQHVSNIQGKNSTKVIGQHGHHHQGTNKSIMDINETFNEYIQRAKKTIRTVSNIGRGQSNPVSAANHESHGGATNKKEDHRENFSDFIQKTKNKLRATTIARRNK